VIIKTILAFLSSLIVGFLVVCLCWARPIRINLLFKLFLGSGVGLGISSCLYLFWCLLFTPARQGFIFFEAALAVMLGFVLFRQRHGAVAFYQEDDKVFQSRGNRIILIGAGIVFVTLLSLLSVRFIISAFQEPNGSHDAWSIYNLRARYIFRDNEYWKDAFSDQFEWPFHPDYPLLLTNNILKVWTQFKVDSPRVPMVQSGFFLFSTIGLLVTALWRKRGPVQAVIAGIVLLSSAYFFRLSDKQIAETPLSFYLLAMAILIVAYFDEEKPRPALLSLAGAAAGFAAWTKNEGLLALAVFLAVMIIYLVINRNWIEFLWLAGGLLLPLTTVFVFKAFLAPTSEFFAGRDFVDLMSLLTNLNRHQMVLKVFAKKILYMGETQYPLLVILLVYALFLGLRQLKQFEKIGIYLVGLMIVLTWIGDYITFVITPYAIDWHLTFASRIIFQVYPMILLILFWIVHTPDDLLSAKGTQDGRK